MNKAKKISKKLKSKYGVKIIDHIYPANEIHKFKFVEIEDDYLVAPLEIEVKKQLDGLFYTIIQEVPYSYKYLKLCLKYVKAAMRYEK